MSRTTRTLTVAASAVLMLAAGATLAPWTGAVAATLQERGGR